MLKSKAIIFLLPLFLVLLAPELTFAEHVKGHVSKKSSKAKKVKKSLDKTKPLGEFELGKYQYSGSDKDCVVVTNGCCDCANGGEDVAINKVRLDDFKGRFECNTVSCGFETPKTNCGEGVVTCTEHKCHYIK